MKRDIFQAIADPTRRAIIALIATQALTPTSLSEHFDMTRQAVSKHIHVLIESKLVRQEQSGREIHYQLNLTKMKEVADWLEPFKQLWEQRFDNLDKYLAKLQKEKLHGKSKK